MGVAQIYFKMWPALPWQQTGQVAYDFPREKIAVKPYGPSQYAMIFICSVDHFNLLDCLLSFKESHKSLSEFGSLHDYQ